ncbi:MAG: serine/threonine protein kinase, partial [Gemmatimonadota bacterium]|nr:serine/threonine protein kinase [Gemmatimonadota bacterium]
MTELRSKLQDALGDAYRIERELSAGGMSRLFLASDTALARVVVVKVLPPDLASALSAARFKREIELTAHLQHPHILPVLNAGARNDLLYYVMPYVAGESLRHRLEREGRLPVVDACRLMREIADALAFAHAEGIVHRDLKPENILLQGSHAVLADFGVAGALLAAQGRPTDSSAPRDRLTSAGHTVGTAAYMAPEQLAAEDDVDGRADIYSLGLVGYEMLAGKRPFADRSGGDLIVARLTESPPPLHEMRAEVPLSLSDAISVALAPKPSDRWQWAAELHDALEGVSVTRTRNDAVSRSNAALRVPRWRSRRWLAAGGVAMFVGAGVAGAWIRWETGSRLVPNLVAVAPFEAYNPALAVWREGLVDLLSRNLDGAGALRTVSPTIIVRQWGEGARSDPAGASELGRRTRAEYVVFGSVISTGRDSVRLTASLLDVASGDVLRGTEIMRVGASDRMDVLTDSLTVSLLQRVGQAGAIAGFRGSSLGSASLPALKAFLQGERHYRRAEWDSAILDYERAVAEDTTFALALRRIGLVITWQRNVIDSVSRSYLARAGRYNHGLSPRDSLLVAADSVRALLSGVEGDTLYLPRTRRLFATLQRAASEYRDDPEVWYAFADAHYHFGLGPGVWVRPRRTLDEFDRVIALDSAFAPAYIHAVELGFDLGGRELGLRYARGYLALHPTDVEGIGIALVEHLAGRADRRPDVVQRLLDTSDVEVIAGAWLRVRRWADSAEMAVMLARELAQRTVALERPDSIFARRRLAAQLAYRGHASEAYSVLGTPRSRLLAELALLGAVPPDTAAAIFAAWTRDDRGEASFALPWWAARGDTAAIAALALRSAAITSAGHNPVTGSRDRYDAAAIQAYAALARRDSAEAIRQFGALPDTLCLACALDRLTKARLFASRGMLREAAALLDERLPTLLSPTEVMFALERARVSKQLQDTEGYS